MWPRGGIGNKEAAFRQKYENMQERADAIYRTESVLVISLTCTSSIHQAIGIGPTMSKVVYKVLLRL